MSQQQSRLLFVDDEPMILDALKRVTRKLDAEIYTAQSGQEALDLMAKNRIDIIISDINMPNMDGITLLSKVSKISPETIRIILTAYTDIDNTLSAINEGKVWGYLHKPWDNKALLNTLNQVIEFQRSLVERTLLKEFESNNNNVFSDNFSGFIGSSDRMQTIYQMIKQCAPSKASVFITGPSGSGKEVAAQALHDLSGRTQGKLIALNCAAIPAELMESEIFGHVKGAFSGANSSRDGAATLAHNGTLFLDEIGEMDILLQAKLLRFIQTGTFSKVGSGKVETVDVRFISATNREPEQAIAEQKLREDLYYRLNVLPIDLPPLCERGDDVVQIAKVFLQKYNQIEDRKFHGFTDMAIVLLKQYKWPGNVRQLQNLIYSAVVISTEPLINEQTLATLLKLSVEQLTDLLHVGNQKSASKQEEGQGNDTIVSTTPVSTPPQSSVSNSAAGSVSNSEGSVTGSLATPLEAENVQAKVGDLPEVDEVNKVDSTSGDQLTISDTSTIPSLASVERTTIEHAINCCNENVVQAAEALGVSPSTLYRKIQQWHKDSA